MLLISLPILLIKHSKPKQHIHLWCKTLKTLKSPVHKPVHRSSSNLWTWVSKRQWGQISFSKGLMWCQMLHSCSNTTALIRLEIVGVWQELQIKFTHQVACTYRSNCLTVISVSIIDHKYMTRKQSLRKTRLVRHRKTSKSGIGTSRISNLLYLASKWHR